VGTAATHSALRYSTTKVFLNQCYEEEDERNPRKAAPQPRPKIAPRLTCLAGATGVGKSHLLTAATRALPVDSQIVVAGHRFPMRASETVHVTKGLSLGAVLGSLARPGVSKGTLKTLLKSCQQHIFQQGISLLLIDETQFLASHHTAKIVQFLLELGEIGVPMVFALNFSLVHQLKKTPSQIKQRLLVSPLIAEPTSLTSEDGIAHLAESFGVAPDIFDLEAEKHAQLINDYSGGGLRRLVRQLLVLSIRVAEASRVASRPLKVREEHVTRAYRSMEFSVNRADVETLKSIALGHKKGKHEHLCCPFERPVQQNARVQAEATRREEIAAALLEASLSPSEKEARRSLVDQRSRTPSKVVLMRRKPGRSAEELIRNAQEFHESLGKPED
jgi:ABC-type cobalamin/Fe3+-siderophores transport system ATPase subunit